MSDKQAEALIRADELEAIGAESSSARAMAAHTIRLLYKENEALRARLAQPEQEKTRSQKMREAGYTKRDTRLECDGCGKKFSRLMLPIHDCESAQPEQEPVAWIYDWYDETEDIDGVPVGGIVSDCISKDYDEAHSPTMGCHNIRPLYTAPPQREWVGLTDEEYEAIREDGQFGKGSIRFKNLFEAIEARLREKNS